MESQGFTSKYITASEVLAKRKCDLSLLIPLSSNATSDLNIYDGEDANGELKLRIRMGSSQSNPFPFSEPLHFKVGLYVDFTQKIDGCLVQWRTLPD